MSRYERRIYFEALCALRARYGRRSQLDRAGKMTIDEVIAWAEAEMAALGPIAETAEQTQDANR
jgi:hypothetical protein